MTENKAERKEYSVTWAIRGNCLFINRDWDDRLISYSIIHETDSYLKISAADNKTVCMDFFSGINLCIIWKSELLNANGCLVGGDEIYKGESVTRHNIMFENISWKRFFRLPKDSIVPFLIDQIGDTTGTQIHVCPCSVALSGEIAVYALQTIYLKNWFDLNEFKDFAHGKTERYGCQRSSQSFLLEIIRDSNSRNKMMTAWKTVYNGK